MRVGRMLPPAAAPIGWRSLCFGISAIFKGDTELDRFSNELKEHFNRSHCFLVSSGKAALTLILVALKEQYPDRDEVIIPAYTCYSVPSAIVRAGLKIKLCDTAEDSFDFDFKQLEPMLKKKKLLAVVPTHLFGLPANIKYLKEINKDPAVTVIEDAAQSMGGEWHGEKLGTLGDVSFFSLGRGKAFSSVEGGVILTDCDRLAASLNLQTCILRACTSFEILKLFLYAVALNVLLHPNLFWLPKGLPFLRLGETIFDPHFRMKKFSSFQAGLSKNWVEKLKLFRQIRQENTIKWLSILDPDIFKLFTKGKTEIPDLIRLPVELRDEQERTRFIDGTNRHGLGIGVAYPGSVSAIPELKDLFWGRDFPRAQQHSKALLTCPVHAFLVRRDWDKASELLSRWS